MFHSLVHQNNPFLIAPWISNPVRATRDLNIGPVGRSGLASDSLETGKCPRDKGTLQRVRRMTSRIPLGNPMRLSFLRGTYSRGVFGLEVARAVELLWKGSRGTAVVSAEVVVDMVKPLSDHFNVK